jgi:membrane protease YdiL (CAAX protease family)
MYKISNWASTHVWPARIIIVCAFVLITVLALFIGGALQLFEITIPLSLFYSSVALFLIIFLIYPDKKYSRRFKNFYQYHKTCDSILLSATFFFLICIGNRPEYLLRLAQPASAAVPYSITTNTKPSIEKEKSIRPLLKKLSKKALEHALIKKMAQLRKAYQDTSKGGKIALIILSVIVALALLFLLAGLSCNIACSGADGLAVLVLLLGTGVIVFFLARVIQRITKGPRRKSKTPSTPT